MQVKKGNRNIPGNSLTKQKMALLLRMSILALAILSPLILNSNQVSGAKILSISFLSTKSHKIVYEPLLYALAERGHEVTVVGPILGKEMKNIRNILTLTTEELEATVKFPNIFDMKLSGSGFFKELMGNFFNPFLMFGGIVVPVCKRSYYLPQVQAIAKEKFDLVIFAPLINDCLYGLIHQLNTSSILISQTAIMPWVGGNFGNPSPPSFVPFGILGYTDKMSYRQRVSNLLGLTYNYLIKEFIYNPAVEKVYRDVFGQHLPSVDEIEGNASLILANSHVSYNKPKPMLPDCIDVGGMHMKEAKPVPKDLEDFFSGPGSKHGFILFSMGSALKGSTMPERYQKLFLNVFSKLKQRVIWKWETEQMDGLPKNVKLSKWLPQQDVLGHKNIKVFITHGGHGSTTEAIYHGVPLVGLPMMGDQVFNMQQASKMGYAVQLDFAELTEEMLLDALNKVINDPSYKEAAAHLSNLYHDQIDKPLDRAVYWAEYVIRHKGARHLRSAARDLTVLQYYSIDVLAGILAVILLSTFVNFLIARAIWRKCCGGSKLKSKPTGSQKKKQ